MVKKNSFAMTLQSNISKKTLAQMHEIENQITKTL